eukprot:TRINITY_DN1175_c0_g1_i4.p3 TRINITY_DN1175_c0_g1~~TRINITY_DN1175_c0_g1_i4.p3  ORF type:complete len:136 (+),score=15.35 TRINITY_DN1175_c0_g1_i4:673-1080(+)
MAHSFFFCHNRSLSHDPCLGLGLGLGLDPDPCLDLDRDLCLWIDRDHDLCLWIDHDHGHDLCLVREFYLYPCLYLYPYLYLGCLGPYLFHDLSHALFHALFLSLCLDHGLYLCLDHVGRVDNFEESCVPSKEVTD